MKKILITGSNGLLGAKLVDLIKDNSDYQLIATSRGENRLAEKEGYQYVSLDITNREEVLSVIAEQQPHYVINTAAMTNVDQCEDEKEACIALNVAAVSYLIEACESNNCFLLHLSTDFIFDGENGPYDEEAVANPLSFYGDSKLQAENLLLKSSIKWAIARTVLVYGIAKSLSRSNIILWVKSSLEQSKQLQIVDDQWRTPTLAEDLAIGCFKIIEHDAEGIFNISGDEMLTPYDMAMQTVDYFKLDGSFITKTDGSKFQQRAKRPAKTGFNIEKARNTLNYQPRSFTEGIQILDKQLQELS